MTPDALVSEPARQRLTYRPELDGLRGIAVLAVMAFHYGLPGGQQGFLGVDVFFVLSGFLITSIIASEWRRAGTVDLRSFYRRRALRLFPALVLMLAAFAVTVPLVDIVASVTYTMNWAMALELIPLARSLGHTWTLAIEWQFYLVWPAVLILGLSRWSPRTVALAVLAVGVTSAVWRAVLWQMTHNWLRVSMGTDTHVDGLLIGSALGIATVYGLVPTINPRWTLAAFAVGAAVVLLPTLPNDAWVLVGELVVVLATAVIIARPMPILAARPLAAIGVISYGLYLWHVPIYIGLVTLGAGIPPHPAIPAVATFVIAAASYRYLERPILRWKARGSRPAARAELASVRPG